MPNKDTFSIKPISSFVDKYLCQSKKSIDPFARNCVFATVTNDINPNTAAKYHLDAREFLKQQAAISDNRFDLVIFDPPYSPRQISECYSEIGKKATMMDTQSASFYKECRQQILKLIEVNGIVLTFGWNSVGMGIKNGFKLTEIMMVCHGGAHNDTICLAEKYIK